MRGLKIIGGEPSTQEGHESFMNGIPLTEGLKTMLNYRM
jgi:hypothetical protein